MKTLMIIPLTLTAVFSKGPITGSSKLFDYFSFSPLYLDGESTLIMKTQNGIFGFDVLISNDIYKKKVIYSDKATSVGTFTYKYDNTFTRDTNTVLVQIKLANKIVASKTFSMNVTSGKNELITNNQPISSDNVIVNLSSDLTIKNRKITYSFTNFDGLYIPEYYHKLKLTDFYINIADSFKPFFSCTPSIVIKNVNGVFNDVSKANNVEFKLKLVETSLGYTFELKNELYVNKETLLLSKTAKAGYVKTKHIYLPRNDMKNQSKYASYFAFTNFGIDKDTLKHHFEFRALQNVIGDCSNSEYCIVRS